MQLDTEVDVPHDGTVLEFCEMTIWSVSSGRALALVGVAGGTRVVAMSDENLVRGQIQESIPAGMLAFLHETPNYRECAFFEFSQARMSAQVFRKSQQFAGLALRAVLASAMANEHSDRGWHHLLR